MSELITLNPTEQFLQNAKTNRVEFNYVELPKTICIDSVDILIVSYQDYPIAICKIDGNKALEDYASRMDCVDLGKYSHNSGDFGVIAGDLLMLDGANYLMLNYIGKIRLIVEQDEKENYTKCDSMGLSALDGTVEAFAINMLNNGKKYFENKKEETRSVYALLNPITNMVKIGISKNIESRKRVLENMCGVKLSLLFSVLNIKDFFKVENELHKKFSEYRQEGEWFMLPESEYERLKEEFAEISKYYEEKIAEAKGK